LDFIRSREFTAPAQTKKAASSEAALFKEAKGWESEETSVDAAPEIRSGQCDMSKTLRVKVFQRLRPLQCYDGEHLLNQISNGREFRATVEN
jgi:hypothetical protein